MPKTIEDVTNICQNACQIHHKSIEIVARSASKRLLEASGFQDFPKWSAEAAFRSLLVGLKTILVDMLVLKGIQKSIIAVPSHNFFGKMRPKKGHQK